MKCSIFDNLVILHKHHLKSSKIYRALNNLYFEKKPITAVDDVPFVPIQFFKLYDLVSVADEEVYKTMFSSGTSGKPSKIYLDKSTADAQIRALANIGAQALGRDRRVMLVLDSPAIMKGRDGFTARTAGVNGFRIFASRLHFVLDDEFRFDDNIIPVLEKIRLDDKPVLIYGFTAQVWQALEVIPADLFKNYIPRGSILIHGGGWKKLEDRRVSEQSFEVASKRSLGVEKVINYYGMIEQVGSIFFKCDSGYFHTTSHSHILVRDPLTFDVTGDGEIGLIQVLSKIPRSYPGHSILTEDLGWMTDQPCECGNHSRRFVVLGRFEDADARGCSDAV